MRQQHHEIVQTERFNRDHVAVGEFVWSSSAAGAPRRRSSVIGDRHLMVIPRHPVRITQHGAEPFVADQRTAVFYNASQPYDAEQLVPDGEHSVFFTLDARAVRDCAADFDPSSCEDANRPLLFTHGPCDARGFALQRRILAYLDREDVDVLAVQEAVATLATRLLRDAFAARGRRERTPTTAAERRRRDLAEAARLLVLRRFREPLSLDDVAESVGLSAHHLCRVFRAHVGRPLHQYRTDLRLRASIDPLCDGRVGLAALALDLGFNSQSHFTTAFARRFGCTPARFRRDVRAGRLPADRSDTFLKDS